MRAYTIGLVRPFWLYTLSDLCSIGCLDRQTQTLVASSAGTGFIHESFHASNASDWTRDWFAWGNGMFGELVMTLLEERPHLLLHDVVRD